MFNKVVLITGMPRSGTSWLGQIVDSSPDVAYRLEPLFSYRYKNIINKESDALSINRFLKSIYLTTDEFICQTESRSIGRYPSYHKNESPSVLAIKTTRHHELLSKYLRCIDDLEVVSIVRHPCAVINSWISTDKEFKDKGCSVAIDWKSGVCRKDGIGESWGFDDWLSETKSHLNLALKNDNFNIIKYSSLVTDSEREIRKLFSRIGIPIERQTEVFLKECNQSHSDDPYSVFKSKSVMDDWRQSLDSAIRDEIIAETVASGLDAFLE